MTRIWLLDLNYTLVENSSQKISPFTRQIEQEVYRQWLVELLIKTGDPVVLITARPDRYRDQTLMSIFKKTDWQPDRTLFNDRGLPPHILKPVLIREYLYPLMNPDPSIYFGLESNPRTRSAYEKMGIKSVPVPKEGSWKVLPKM